MKTILALNRKLTLLFYLFSIFLFGNFIIRIVLWLGRIQDISILDLPGIFGLGLFHDVIELFYFGIPFVLFFLLIPYKWICKQFMFYIIFFISLVITAFTIFQGFSEWLFWAEFGKRFNFIAVDYLVYTKEVVGNIKESYNLSLIFSIVGIATLMSAYPLFKLFKRKWDDCNFQDSFAFWPLALGYFVVPILLFNLGVTFRTTLFENNFSNNLAGNGLYYLFNAYWNNELNYDEFYPTESRTEMLTLLQDEFQNPSAHLTTSGVLQREIKGSGPEKRYNIFFITVESLSAEFLTAFGNKQNLTPYLDQIAKESMFFTRFFASGTRTVRGLEALNLSISPTPGYSIVKRPHNENLYTLGYYFKKRNYDVRYIYAGYSYFDNMKYFFSQNGYEVVDRDDFSKTEIAYANIWGVDDHSMFKKALKIADKSYRQGKPFFNFVMTISNHRPYTYPDGLIDIPSHSGREGGVKFTDFAIGKFLATAKNKPWFDNTIFVIVADHCHSSAGKSHIPVWKYHIPLMIYAPKIIKPQVIDRVGGQIDIAPTLFALLNFSYKSQFLGRNLLIAHKHERALLGTFQNLGLLEDGKLYVMSPQGREEFYSVDMNDLRFRQTKISPIKKLKDKAISYYQYASWLWHTGKMKRNKE